MRSLLQLFRMVGSLLARFEDRFVMALSNEMRVERLRRKGVRIGEGCLLYSTDFSTEPYLVELGDHVAVSARVRFITHDATAWVWPHHAKMDVFGRIVVGSNTYFGVDCIILPGTTIGRDCVIGAGSVVRGDIPDGSVVMGNPARVIMKTSLLEQLLVNHKNHLETRGLPPADKEQVLRRHFNLPRA